MPGIIEPQDQLELDISNTIALFQQGLSEATLVGKLSAIIVDPTTSPRILVAIMDQCRNQETSVAYPTCCRVLPRLLSNFLLSNPSLLLGLAKCPLTHQDCVEWL